MVTLTTYDTTTGNYPLVTLSLMENIRKETAPMKTYSWNSKYLRRFFRLNFHVLRDGILIFICLADTAYDSGMAFTFLQELKGKFREKFSNE